MASRSNSGHRQHNEDRPTLPPIRDLFHDLRKPHDSPSMTLARMRVSDDHDDPSGYVSKRPSSQGPFGHRADQLTPQTPHLYQSNPHRQHQNPAHSLLNDSHRGGPLQHTSENEMYSHDPHYPGIHYPEHSGYSAREWPPQQQHRSENDIATSSTYSYESRYGEHSQEERTPVTRYPLYGHPGSSRLPGYPLWDKEIPTTRPALGAVEDETTPVPRHAGPSSQHISPPSWRTQEDATSVSTQSKYECSYCGKGFNRPSSLKIHLNSHTGEKPFVCSVESCGRSFSVLSNMRRHARVHMQTHLQQAEPSSDDEDSEPSSSFTGSAPTSAAQGHLHYAGDSTYLHRRSSTASVSSTSSLRSHASGEDNANQRPHAEKRSRRHPK